MAELTVSDTGTAYEARTPEGAVAGAAFYERAGAVVVFTHTEVEPAFEGQGVGSRIVRAALDDVREKGQRVRPLCPFVKGWIDKHPDYADLLVSPE
jgi:predicted GNAT family acetyltransferase